MHTNKIITQNRPTDIKNFQFLYNGYRNRMILTPVGSFCTRSLMFVLKVGGKKKVVYLSIGILKIIFVLTNMLMVIPFKSHLESLK